MLRKSKLLTTGNILTSMRTTTAPIKESASNTAISSETRTNITTIAITTVTTSNILNSSKTVESEFKATNSISTSDKILISDITTNGLPWNKANATTEKVLTIGPSLDIQSATTNSWNTSFNITTKNDPTSESIPNDDWGST